MTMRYLGVSRDRILNLKRFRGELIDISRHYFPFKEHYVALHAVMEKLDDAADLLIREKDVLKPRLDKSRWKEGDGKLWER